MIWVTRTTREGLFELLEASREPPHFEAAEGTADILSLGRSAVDGSVILVYRDRPVRAGIRPSALLVTESGLRDFFAWSWTYLNQLRPLTAFYRVLSPLAFDRVGAGRHELPTLGSLESACVGLILTEVAGYVGDRFDASRISLLGCQGTFGFVAARSLALDGTYDEQELADEWAGFRRSTGQAEARTSLETVRQPWRVLSALWSDRRPTLERQEDATIAAVARELSEGRSPSGSLWSTLAASLGMPGAVVSEFVTGRREERVVATERLLGQLTAAGPQGGTRDFVAGLIVSLIAPGTLEHGGLLKAHLSQLPGALLWYGLCAGLQAPTQVGRAGLFPSTVARRLVRELLVADGLLDQPRGDIASRELQVLAAAPAHDLVSQLRTAVPGLIAVELAPGVVATTKWPPQRAEEASAADSHQRNLFGTSRDENGGVLYELRDAVDLANFLARRLSSVVAKIGRPSEGRVGPDVPTTGEDSTSRRRKRR